jgi:hypothetical protein
MSADSSSTGPRKGGRSRRGAPPPEAAAASDAAPTSLALKPKGRQEAAPRSSGLSSAGQASSKPPARVVFIAWGDRYLDMLLGITIPAVLAPGNLPILASAFDCEVAIVTESHQFEKIRRSLIYPALSRHARIKLISFDDLLYDDMYGLTITVAFFRGIEDLGPRMTETYLLFLFTDFIVADGSLGKVAEKMVEGQRLIMAPSYRVIEHKATPEIRKYYDEKSASLAIPRREMARIILQNRHNTIKAKTVNQRLYYMDLFEQFYWSVDEHTLLGRQAPFALVCMRPERPVYELDTFWDYGILEAACPNTRITALTDSDDFCMAEIQHEDAQVELFKFGWPSFDQIAQRLAFTTTDHRTLGQFPLYLHSQDLPSHTSEAKAKLDVFVEEVFRRLPPPTPAPGHPYWEGQKELYRRKRQIRLDPSAADLSEEEYFRRFDEFEHLFKAPFSGAGKSPPVMPAGIDVGGEFGRIRYPRPRPLLGRYPNVSKLHVHWHDLEVLTTWLAEACQKDALAGLAVMGQGGAGLNYFKKITGDHLLVHPQTLISKHFPAQFFRNRMFDVCLCELDLGYLKYLQVIVERIWPAMNKGGRIFVFCRDAELEWNARDVTLMRNVMPVIGTSYVHFAGSPLLRRVQDLRRRIGQLQVGRPKLGRLVQIAAILFTTPFVWIENHILSKRPSYATHDMMRVNDVHPIQGLTSVTFRFDVE